jgi:polar amino acid transport system permease protein
MFDLDYTLGLLPILAKGLIVTVQASLLGMALALVLGLLLAIARRSRLRPLAWASAGWIEFVRSTPLLIQLYFLYYVLPEIGLGMPALVTGVLALGLHYSCYCAEVYRAGIEAVPRGQWEAARALGLRGPRLWSVVILPQALPPQLPALGNYLIAMFKDTPLLSAITVMELLQVARISAAEQFRYLEPLTLVGLAFLLLSLVAAQGVRLLEARYANPERKA